VIALKRDRTKEIPVHVMPASIMFSINNSLEYNSLQKPSPGDFAVHPDCESYIKGTLDNGND
jgi:hypothetical protein